uniref:hypothetical protein n=1 Tax=Prevotella sp. TaxID=59823 RepID=UPI0025E1C827
MAKITNEQKLYVLLYGTYNKNEQEKSIWGIIKDRYSKDSSWFVDVAKNLNADNYVNYSCGMESGSHWAATDLGRKQIPILWNGSTLKKEHEEEVKALKKESSFEVRHKKINKFLWILLTAIVSSLVTIIVSNLLSQFCRK